MPHIVRRERHQPTELPDQFANPDRPIRQFVRLIRLVCAQFAHFVFYVRFNYLSPFLAKIFPARPS